MALSLISREGELFWIADDAPGRPERIAVGRQAEGTYRCYFCGVACEHVQFVHDLRLLILSESQTQESNAEAARMRQIEQRRVLEGIFDAPFVVAGIDLNEDWSGDDPIRLDCCKETVPLHWDTKNECTSETCNRPLPCAVHNGQSQNVLDLNAKRRIRI